MCENFTLLFKTLPNLRSLALIDTNVGKMAMKNIAVALGDRNKRVSGLNFKYCYLDLKSVVVLSLGIKVNRSLVYLNLSNNKLSSIAGI